MSAAVVKRGAGGWVVRTSCCLLAGDVDGQGGWRWATAAEIPRPKRKRTLPNVSSKDEIRSFLEAMKTPKPRAIAMVLCSGGFRVKEVARTRPGTEWFVRSLSERANQTREDQRRFSRLQTFVADPLLNA